MFESCRFRKMLKNAYLDAKIGVDTAENEPSKVLCFSLILFHPGVYFSPTALVPTFELLRCRGADKCLQPSLQGSPLLQSVPIWSSPAKDSLRRCIDLCSPDISKLHDEFIQQLRSLSVPGDWVFVLQGENKLQPHS